MSEEITKDLIQTRNEIRKKYLALKRGTIDQTLEQEKTFKPLIDPLKELIHEKKKTKSRPSLSDAHTSTPSKIIKKEIKETPKIEFSPIQSSYRPSKIKKRIENDQLYQTAEESSRLNFDEEEEGEDNVANNTFLPEPTDFILSPEPSSLMPTLERGYTSLFQDKLGHIGGKYMKLYLSENPELDHVYGIRREQNEEGNFQFRIGDSEVEVDKNDIKVGDKWYQGTPGLFELMVKKQPSDYTREDLKTYKEIIIKTNTHRVGNLPHNQIKGSRGQKYREIIKPLIEEKEGASYKYWNDPNELVERLKLLVASSEAGHNSHNNEIVSIIEELKESGYVYN